MTSKRERVALPGILWGNGYEAECTVLATKVSLPGTDAVAFCEYSVQGVSKKLPEGRYKLSVNAQIIPMRFHSGFWLSDGPA